MVSAARLAHEEGREKFVIALKIERLRYLAYGSIDTGPGQPIVDQLEHAPPPSLYTPPPP